MALEFFTQLLRSLCDKICDKICRGNDDDQLAETFRCLPDCLVIDILSRLPVDTLVRCQCRRDMRALISSQYFTTLHLSRARPLLLLVHKSMRNNQLNVFFQTFDNKEGVWELPNLSRQPKLKWGKYSLSFSYSCQGVLLFASSWLPHTPTPTPTPTPTCYVLNPTTQEEVLVPLTPEPGQLCALYFCGEFRLLFAQIRGSLCQYFVFIFKTRTWRKIRSSTKFNFLPFRPPAVVNGALHWITYTDLEKKGLPPSCASSGIIVFRMDKEELSAKPHPGSVCNTEKEHQMMALLVKENCLSFCHLLVSGLALDIWILEDYEMWAWNKRYKVNPFPEITRQLRLRRNEELPIDMYWQIRLICIQDDELLFYFPYDDYLVFYNLNHNTVKRVILPPSLRAYGACIRSLLPIA